MCNLFCKVCIRYLYVRWENMRHLFLSFEGSGRRTHEGLPMHPLDGRENAYRVAWLVPGLASGCLLSPRKPPPWLLHARRFPYLVPPWDSSRFSFSSSFRFSVAPRFVSSRRTCSPTASSDRPFSFPESLYFPFLPEAIGSLRRRRRSSQDARTLLAWCPPRVPVTGCG